MGTPPTHWWKLLHASWGKCPNLRYQVRKKAVTCWFLENWQYIRNTTSSCITWEGFRVLNTSQVLPSSSSTCVSPPSLKDPQKSSGFQKRGVGSGLDIPSAFPSDPDLQPTFGNDLGEDVEVLLKDAFRLHQEAALGFSVPFQAWVMWRPNLTPLPLQSGIWATCHQDAFTVGAVFLGSPS